MLSLGTPFFRGEGASNFITLEAPPKEGKHIFLVKYLGIPRINFVLKDCYYKNSEQIGNSLFFFWYQNDQNFWEFPCLLYKLVITEEVVILPGEGNSQWKMWVELLGFHVSCVITIICIIKIIIHYLYPGLLESTNRCSYSGLALHNMYIHKTLKYIINCTVRLISGITHSYFIMFMIFLISFKENRLQLNI